MVLMKCIDKTKRGFKSSDTGRRYDFEFGEIKDIPSEFVGRAEANGLIIYSESVVISPAKEEYKPIKIETKKVKKK